MPSAHRLRSADELVGPKVAALASALECPASDAPLLALARRMAAVIDDMPDAVAVSMLPNHAGPLIRVLAELDARSRKRRDDHTTRSSRLRDLRVASQAPSRRRPG